MALSGRQEQAAALVAAGLLTVEQVAEHASVTRKTLFNWRHLPEFALRVEEIRAEIREKAVMTGIALVNNRVARLNDTWERMQQVIKERAERGAELNEAPGAATGLLARQVKTIRVIDETDGPEVAMEPEGQPHGGWLKRNRKDGEASPRSVEVVEYVFDRALVAELREHEKQASIELHQWQEKSEVTHRGQISIRSITAVKPAAAAGSDDAS